MADKTAPESQLRLEWVYGYRGHQCRNNLFYNANKDLVYFVAGVGIVYNVRDHKQGFFLGHDDDIVSLTLHPDRLLVATGQIGKAPYICVWDSNTTDTVSILKDGHQNGVGGVGFDKEGNRLVSVGMDQHATINVWDWKKGKIIATARGHSDKVFDIQFHPFKPNTIASCGVKHIKFWSLCGNTLSPKKGVFGKTGEIQTMLCLAFGSDGATYSGTLSGDVYIWRENNLERVVSAAHGGPVYTMDMGDTGFVTGGKDGAAKLWDLDFKNITTFNLVNAPGGYKGLCVRSVCWRGDQVLIGTQDSEIFEVQVKSRDKPLCLVQGHAEGELWALATHPKKPIFATASDDQTVRLWNMSNYEVLSRTSVEQKVRSCAFDNEGQHIALGMMDGSFMVLRTRDLSELIHIKDRKEVIHEMKFSPCGKFLAVASNDNFVDIYATDQRYKRVGTCSGSSSFITHLDWSQDSRFLQTNSGAGERLFFRMPVGKQATNTEEIQSIHWASFTGVLGAEVNGIWEKYTDTNDVNATDAAFEHQVTVTGDDFGLVKLFRFPCLKKGAKFRKYVGHSAHVTNVRFSADKRRVISTGGADHAVFQWRLLPQGAGDDDLPDIHNAYVDSNSEDSDSDLSDVGEVDSDVEREKQVKYGRHVYREDAAQIKKFRHQEMKAGKKRNMGPEDGLKLEYIHGYRGYDCRNNLFYTQTGEIVYHVAAAAIIYNKEKNQQRFYTQHTDDILCLCIHPLKDLIATGQVGRDPSIHVWDVETLKTGAILKGQHQRGVCTVDFSADGKRLASVGLDDNHSIVIWDWKKGEKLATTRGHKDKIFVIKWNPFDATKLVTVGVKHIKFWNQTGGGFTSNRGTVGKIAKLGDMLCVSYGKTADVCFSGGSDGNVFIWNGVSLQKVVKAHEGPVFAMHSLDKGFVTGGKDGMIGLWDDQFERCLKTYGIKKEAVAEGSKGMLTVDSPAVRAIVLGHGKILVGTMNGEILEVDKAGPMTVIAQGHKEGEIWGLATHPTKAVYATVSDDRSVRLWSYEGGHQLISFKVLKQAARCAGFSPDGKALAVGLKDGSFVVLNTETMEEMASFHHRKEEISDIKFSPDLGKYLAVASHDNFVDIYNVMGTKRVGTCKGASSYITHIDWDSKGKVIMVNSGAKEQLFFEAPRGHRITLRSTEIEKFDWASWTGVLGATCEGIWPAKSDVTDVNAASLSGDRGFLATADDFGFVKLFRYPAKGKFAKFKKYPGHSAHVTNVRWTQDGRKLVSTGGADTAVMVWARQSVLDKGGVQGESDDSDTDSEEEGYDSDVEREKKMDYSTKIYASSVQEKEGVRPNLQEQEEEEKPAVSRSAPEPPKVKKVEPATAGGKKRKMTPVTNLELEYIHGYRGFDARSNLYYVNNDSDIIFHAAGAGIVQNLSSGTQSFYLKHTDDIIALTVNQHPKFKSTVATAQIGNPPTVHVWDAITKETLSILQGDHKGGICSVDFSCTGKMLLTVGLEEDHDLTVWRWQDGTKVATGPGHNQRIFRAEFRPDSDTQFVSVGVKHVKFWSVAGSQLMGKRGILGKVDMPAGAASPQKMQTMLSLAFGANNMTFTGALSGDVYVWQDSNLSRVVTRAHNGPVFTMFTTLRDGLIVTGGKELPSKDSGPVKLWDQDMKRCKAFPLKEPAAGKAEVIKAVCRSKGKILIGTRDNDIYEVNEKSGSVSTLMASHAEGLLWALDCHPSAARYITAGFDNTLRLWDLHNRSMLAKLEVGSAKSAAFSPDGELIAVGLKTGEFVVLTTAGLKLWGRKRDRSSPINDIKFSPNSKLLAVGSEDCCVDLYDLSQGTSLNRAGYCKGIPSFVIQMDFSADGQYIRVSTGAYINQVFAVPAGTIVEDEAIISKITWNTWTSILGKEVLGIWPKDASKADVNCAHLSHLGNSLATGDDFGYVKLFDFPCPGKHAPHKKFVGHSAHVTNVRFTFDDKHLISTGGDDCSVFVWKCL
ncbi:echinoderm microtubule-associated protein-like 6 [Littorina saxatilis]|uniref:Echinoderm microtubule-associated protein-like 6 n=1 Tax=Littorina saxatilis TaxID=31220 RepID=A0AAN9GCF1_9CAEN